MAKTMVPMKNYPKVLVPVLHDVVIRTGNGIFRRDEYDEI